MRRSYGWSALEFAVTVAILVALAAILLDRLAAIQGDAERHEVEETIRRLDLALQIEWQRDPAHAQALVQGDVLELLERRANADSTRWRYDAATRIISYQPRRSEHFGGAKRLGWRIVSIVDAEGRVVAMKIAPLKLEIHMP